MQCETRIGIQIPTGKGKSTLLNHLFHTSFKEMNALKGRNQTTHGFWLSQAGCIEPFTLVMDLEGTDGSERGEEDTTFEKQSALLTLAISDIVLINMWCHDIGREHAANKPLLKTVFQVMMRLFSPRKTTLLFVIRDKTKTPLEVLEPNLRKDIQKIWNSIPKPPKAQEIHLSDFFKVEVTALSNYEEKENVFKEEVSNLRKKFFNSIALGELARNRSEDVPASAFPLSIKQIWKTIKENKDLDLPSLKEMVANFRCEEIAKEKINQLANDEHWRELKEAAQSGCVSGFGRKLSDVLHTYFSSYDSEVLHFVESIRTLKRQTLVNESLNLVYPTYKAMLRCLCSKVLSRFKDELEEAVNNGKEIATAVQNCTKNCMAEFDQGCADARVKQANWDSTKIRNKLQKDIDSHAALFNAKTLAELLYRFKMQLNHDLTQPVASLLDEARPNTWSEIRKLLEHVTEKSVSNFTSAVARFGIDNISVGNMNEELKMYAKSVVEKTAREEAAKVLIHMKNRFSNVFSYDARVCSGKEDIRAITKDACSTSLKLLSVMAALRFGDKPDEIEAILSSALIDNADAAGTFMNTSTPSSLNALELSTWEGLPSSDVLITPDECRSLWSQFYSETKYIVDQALAVQEANTGDTSSPADPAASAQVAIGLMSVAVAVALAPVAAPVVVAAACVAGLSGAFGIGIMVKRLFQRRKDNHR